MVISSYEAAFSLEDHLFVFVAFGLIVFNPRSTSTVNTFNEFLFVAFSPCESFLDLPVIVAPEPLPCQSFSHDRAIRVRMVSQQVCEFFDTLCSLAHLPSSLQPQLIIDPSELLQVSTQIDSKAFFQAGVAGMNATPTPFSTSCTTGIEPPPRSLPSLSSPLPPPLPALMRLKLQDHLVDSFVHRLCRLCLRHWFTRK